MLFKRKQFAPRYPTTDEKPGKRDDVIVCCCDVTSLVESAEHNRADDNEQNQTADDYANFLLLSEFKV